MADLLFWKQAVLAHQDERLKNGVLLGGSECRPDLERVDRLWVDLLWSCLRDQRWVYEHERDLHCGQVRPTKTPGVIVAEIPAKWEGDTASRDHIPEWLR
jgi:hypothetical protein